MNIPIAFEKHLFRYPQGRGAGYVVWRMMRDSCRAGARGGACSDKDEIY